MAELPEKYPPLESIVNHHKGIVEAVKEYFSMLKKQEGLRWPEWMDVGDTPLELDEKCNSLLAEEGVRTCFALVGYIEDTFKAHFLYVINLDNQNSLFHIFSTIYSRKKTIKNVSFRGDILDSWLTEMKMDQSFYDDLKKAFEFRNWFAHGRFFTLNTDPAGNASYEYNTLRLLAEDARKLCSDAEIYLT